MPFESVSETMKVTDFDAIRLRLASPDAIRAWSHGEVSKPETINYRTQKPEKSGLFAEEIFGPSKDWECYCGKYKKIRYKGIICDKCGVEVTQSIVRRERMGHIELAAPVSHIWFLRSVPSKIGIALDSSIQSLEKVIYFANFIITEVDEQAKQKVVEELKQEYKSKRKMIEGEYQRDAARIAEKFASDQGAADAELARLASVRDNKMKELEEEYFATERELRDLEVMKIISENKYHELSMKYGHIFDAGIGAEAVLELLRRINIKETLKRLEEEKEGASGARLERIVRRVKLLRSLDQTGINPAWMILTVVPVIPPDLRPMVPLDGGRFATSDLNDLYRRVINRNNRMRRLKELRAPEVIVRNEKRMLQEAVDALIDNSARHSKTVVAATGRKRQLKSLADLLKGKQGRFRQNLLGKRIDYSGRSVIVVGPYLRINQCGLPKKMALELFKPFVISKLISREYVHNIRSANRFIESDRPEIWDILEETTKDALVLLNRAPTLHRLGIQAFQPVLIEGKAIQIHPLVCPAFNADFDGDQMAVHVPLTEEAKKEARELMLSTNNLLKPATGKPVARPDRDVAWGCYYMTMIPLHFADKEPRLLSSIEAMYLYQIGQLRLQEPIKIRLLGEGEFTVTTLGRILVNRVFPKGIPFRNETMGVKQLGDITQICLEQHGFARTAEFLDEIKDLGFSYVTKSGYSWGMGELPDLSEKKAVLEEGDKQVREIEEQYMQGLLTARERHTQIIKVWTAIKEKIVHISRQALPPSGSVSTMLESGVRGSIAQLVQMIGMKGLVSNPAGEIIELPVKNSFKEGFDVLEYFISTHGTRKGLSDTALRTANAGYLTRRLVDVSQDIVVLSDDCGDEEGTLIAKVDIEAMGETFDTILHGRVLAEDLKDGRKLVIRAGEFIDSEKLAKLRGSGAEEVRLRTVMTCKRLRGICRKCYGYDLAYQKPVDMGVAVGIIAAQSIGEPGTQLTMRTFHTGGVAGQDITQGLPRVEEVFEARPPKHPAIITDVAGKIEIEQVERRLVESATGKTIVDTQVGQKVIRIRYSEEAVESHTFAKKDKVLVSEGDSVLEGQEIIERADNTRVAAVNPGLVKLEKNKLQIAYPAEKVREYVIPPGARVLVKNGEMAETGAQLTEGNIDLHDLYRLRGKVETQKYMLREIQSIYSSQGQKLNNKHIEVILRQVFSRVYVKDAGDSELLPGEIMEKSRYLEETARVKKSGGKPPEADELLLGISRVSLTTESFLSAASFQETARVLINAALTGKVDRLEGLKENVIIGRLIPAGTGYLERHEDSPRASRGGAS